jgi:threonine synthase
MTATAWQQCAGCGARTALDAIATSCPGCDGLLSVEYDFPVRPPAIPPRDLHPSGVWRFGDVVMPGAAATAVTYPEGNTPLLWREALDRFTGIGRLHIKHEGHNPTGSFKDRGMTVAMTQARRTGARAVACASTGNTSASLAAYAAHAGIPAFAVVPDGQVTTGKLAQTLGYGARTLLVDGDFDDCLRLLQQAGEELGVYLVNSVNPWRIEGQKTIVFDLLQQLEWQAPDWIVLPAGNLGNTAAFGKAIREALRWGWIDRAPRIAAIQAAGAAPFAAAFARGFDELIPVHADTIASAIRIGAPASYHRAVRAIRDTNGVVLAVSDEEILRALVAVDSCGVGCEPGSAAAVAGARALRARGVIGERESAVAVLTGHVLKDPGTLERIHASPSIFPAGANRPQRIGTDLHAIAAIIEQSSRAV